MAGDAMDRVVPLSDLDDFHVAEGEPDVRGWDVMASDGQRIGEVEELLIDTTADKVRYLDVDVDSNVLNAQENRHILIPIGYARLDEENNRVMVDELDTTRLAALPVYDRSPLTAESEASLREGFDGARLTRSEERDVLRERAEIRRDGDMNIRDELR